MMFSKPIKHLWLSVTHRCNFRCGYCYVVKDRAVVDTVIARRAIQCLVDSPGTEKVLDLYGGEPLVVFPLVRELAAYARTRAEQRGKTLTVKMATNGSLVRDEHIEFLRDFGVWLSVSLDGDRPSQNAFRRFRSGTGTFARVRSRVSHLLERYGTERVQALVTVHPRLAGRMFDNILSLVDFGFDAFHVNPVSTTVWDAQSRRQFALALVQVLRLLLESIRKGSFLFFEPVSQALHARLNGRNGQGEVACPFSKKLTLLPTGMFAFLPDLSFEKAEGRYLLGSVEETVRAHADCTFEMDSDRCRRCVNLYRSPVHRGFEHKVQGLRNAYCERVATHLLNNMGERIVREYAHEANTRLFE